MKKLIGAVLALALLAYLGWLPFRSTELSGLLPVKTVVVMQSGKEYAVDVGASVRAVGSTLKKALTALKEEVSGTVFFQTAEQVVIATDAAEVLEEAASEQAFRPSTAVLLSEQSTPDAEALGEYLQAHPTETTISDLRAQLAGGGAIGVPLVCAADGGYRLFE